MTSVSTPSPGAWEVLRRRTLDELVTATKLTGSALVMDLVTTPEGYPATVIIAVGKPGNEPVPKMLMAYFRAAMARAGAPTVAEAINPEHYPVNKR